LLNYSTSRINIPRRPKSASAETLINSVSKLNISIAFAEKENISSEEKCQLRETSSISTNERKELLKKQCVEGRVVEQSVVEGRVVEGRVVEQSVVEGRIVEERVDS
jgi:hypothetical protein